MAEYTIWAFPELRSRGVMEENALTKEYMLFQDASKKNKSVSGMTLFVLNVVCRMKQLRDTLTLSDRAKLRNIGSKQTCFWWILNEE